MNGLRLLNASQSRERFQLHDNAAVTKEIRSIWCSLRFALVGNRNGLFPLKWNAALSEFNGQSPLIHDVQETVAEFAMHLNGRADHRVGLLIAFFSIGVNLGHL